MGFAAPAHVRDEAAREKARGVVVEGAKLFEAGKFEEALESFASAYRIFPSAKIHFNMALAHGRMGRHALAVTFLERFFSEVHDASPSLMAEARAELDRLSRKVGFVKIGSDANGAEVFIDGARVGITPIVGRLPVEVGRHELEVRSPNVGARSTRFAAVPGRTLEVRVDFAGRNVATQPSASGVATQGVELPSSASQAETLIRQATDLRKAGKDARAYPLFQKAYETETTPRTAAQLGLVEMQLGYWLLAERHLAQALSFPRDPWISGNRADLEASLARARAAIGEIVVRGTPAGAKVLVNGKDAGTLPLQAPVRAGEGPVTVEVQAPRHESSSRSLTLLGGRREEVILDLRPLGSAAAQPALTPAPDTGRVASGMAGDLETESTPESRGWLQRMANPGKWAVAVASAGVFGFAVYETIVWRSRFEEFESFLGPALPGERRTCGVDELNRGARGCAEIYSDLDRARKLAIVGYAAGGALAVGAAALYLVAPRASDGQVASLVCGPMLAVSGGACRIRF